VFSSYFIIVFNTIVSPRKLTDAVKHLFFIRHFPGSNRSEPRHRNKLSVAPSRIKYCILDQWIWDR